MDTEIIGFKTQFGMIYDRKEEGLFTITSGFGNCKDDPLEGIKKNSFYGTSLLGPLFIQNPLFVKILLKKLSLDDSLKFEEEIFDAYEDRFKGYHHFLLKDQQ